jgi:hypothetical protein
MSTMPGRDLAELPCENAPFSIVECQPHDCGSVAKAALGEIL